MWGRPAASTSIYSKLIFNMSENKPAVQTGEGYNFPPESPSRNYDLKPTRLQVALKGMEITEIFPRLSVEEQRILLARYRLVNGSRYRSQKAAAKHLGLSVEEYRRFEEETIDQVSFLAGIGRNNQPNPNEEDLDRRE